MTNLELQKTANEIRKSIVTAVHSAKAGHPGGSLSAADIFTYLYFEELNIDPKNPKMADRDRFVLSKGHTAPGLYAALAERGFFPKEDLVTLRHTGSYLQGHPDMKHIPGVDMSSGSLGQGLSVAVGMAAAGKFDKKDYRVYALCGDGEIQEGQIWEAAMWAGFKKLDNLYYGDVRKWYKYLHSLQLRIAMRIVYVKPELAREIAEKAVAAGVIENNEDNAQLHVEENRSALCFNDWKDYRIAAEIVSYMQGYNDPRLEKYFTQGKYQDDTDYYGLRIGILPSKVTDDELIQTYSNRLMTANDTYMWMTAAEVTFLRAEGALRGWAMSGDAQQLYEKAITLSFEQWGASGASGYSQNKTLVPGAYKDPRGTYSAQSPSSITIAWNEDKENTRFEENLERIITQKWIAMFPLGIEAWCEHRRTGYPKFLPIMDNKGVGITNLTLGIRRLSYPAEEYQLNAENMLGALRKLNGEDNGATRLWWDCNPNVK